MANGQCDICGKPATVRAQVVSNGERRTMELCDEHYRQIARPFDWTFTGANLERVLAKVTEREPRLTLATQRTEIALPSRVFPIPFAVASIISRAVSFSSSPGAGASSGDRLAKSGWSVRSMRAASPSNHPSK